MLENGDIVAGKFRIERLLAEGGMGAVFRARHLETERPAALKVLWPDLRNSEQLVAKFQLEAKVAALVQSEHIVSVLDAGLDPERAIPYLAMELLEGCTLRELALPLSPPTVALYLSQLASALDKAHGYVDKHGQAQPIIHCDLKPDNVFLTHRESGVPEIKVLDFGMARMNRDQIASSAEVRGTPLYMAIEQIQGTSLSPATDIWAMGLISYFLLVGRPYWRAGTGSTNLTDLLTEIMSLPLATPTERALELGARVTWPDQYDTWFLRCVNREPSRRFASAGVAATELSTIFGSGSERAAPVSLGQKGASGAPRDDRARVVPAPSRLAHEPTERLDSVAGQVALSAFERAVPLGTPSGLRTLGPEKISEEAAASRSPAHRRARVILLSTALLVAGIAALLFLLPHGADARGTPAPGAPVVPLTPPVLRPAPNEATPPLAEGKPLEPAPPPAAASETTLPSTSLPSGPPRKNKRRPESPRTEMPVYKKR